RVVALIFTFALLVPQIFVLAQPHTARYCGAHLFELLIVSIVFTFCMIGFSSLFSIMEPTPWEVKVAFHIFGGISFFVGVLLGIFTLKAEECRGSTEALYYFSMAAAILSVLSICFLIVMLPFWIVNHIRKNSVLDLNYRDGICYEPVSCCSCLWHI
ncbi:hypothetical protein LSH36_166g01030, partial [Paralvinella palmiformis]